MLLTTWSERLLAIIAVLFLLPIISLIFLLVFFLERENPVFKQVRVGLQGKPFIIYKFRTMSKSLPKTEQNNASSYEDIYQQQLQRVTPIGSFLRKYSLDELPQLFNIINGTMSFVGPRPLLVKQLDAIPPCYQSRHNVFPGITGLAQVKGRRALSWISQLRYDNFYSSKKSFLFDMKIVLLTFKSVLTSEGVEPSKGKNWREYL